MPILLFVWFHSHFIQFKFELNRYSLQCFKLQSLLWWKYEMNFPVGTFLWKMQLKEVFVCNFWTVVGTGLLAIETQIFRRWAFAYCAHHSKYRDSRDGIFCRRQCLFEFSKIIPMHTYHQHKVIKR